MSAEAAPPALETLLHPTFLNTSQSDYTTFLKPLVDPSVFTFPLLSPEGCSWFLERFRGAAMDVSGAEPESNEVSEVKPVGGRHPNKFHHKYVFL
jgi:hypothetical protein